MRATPDQMHEAEIMAKHFHWARTLVLKKRGRASKPWDLLPREERQVLTDTFIIILGAADKELEDRPLKRAHR